MHALVFLISALSLCSFSAASYVEASNNQSGFTIDLIHRDSLFSPFYNSSKSILETITNSILRSNSRINQFSQSILLNKNNESLESIMIPNGGTYLMKIYIGNPPVESLAIADTGSDLTWIQCLPCLHCFKQDTPIFDKRKSSTFTNVSCGSKPCSLLPKGKKSCGSSKKCRYSYKYADQSFSVGELGIDLVTFGFHKTKFPKTIFGCGNFNELRFNVNGKTVGIVGLGGGPLSLVSQLGDFVGNRFSYCLVPFNSNTTSKIRFGNQAKIIGENVMSTPIITNPSLPTFYLLNLRGITVGNKTTRTWTTDGNILIDSGTTLTYLEPFLFDAFVTSLEEKIGLEAMKDVTGLASLPFCFTYEKALRFPDVVFHFHGAGINLKFKNLFLSHNNLFCLAVVNSNFHGLSVFGNIAQVDFQVEYNLLKWKKVSFAPTDCEKLNSIS